MALAEEEVEEPEEVRDGAWLYERNCSGCHGMTGAGDGPTSISLGVKARSFAEGGFSFGNTREAILRTLRSGIPGRSIMPPFEGVLSEEELGLVIDHLFTLMPPRDEEDTRASVLTVRSRPVIARGKLPPIAEGLPEHPRGLLIGLPEGLTFEYDIEDVKLLAVRLGDFADREDWRDRGGGYLRPLGALVQVFDLGEGDSALSAMARHGTVDMPTRLRSTIAKEGGVEMTYVAQSFAVSISIIEQLHVVATSAGPAFSRRFRFQRPEFTPRLHFRPLGSVPRQSPWRQVTSTGGWECQVSTGTDETLLLIAIWGDVEIASTGSENPLELRFGFGPREQEEMEVTALCVPMMPEARLAELARELTR